VAVPAEASALVAPDAEARARMGRNWLDPEFRAGSAEAGLAQADRVAGLARAAWGRSPTDGRYLGQNYCG